MGYLFSNAQKFNLDLSRWNVSSVTTMDRTFLGAQSFNQDISDWEVGGVVSFNKMFLYAHAFDQDISRWDVTRALYMSTMFYGASSFNQNLSKWDTSSVTQMYRMFYQASSFNGDISSWDISRVTTFESMFEGASSFDQSLCWDLPDSATREDMFLDSPGSAQAFATGSLRRAVTAWCRNGSATAAATYGGIANWCTRGVEDMSELFYVDGAYCGANSSRFNEDLSRWNVSRVKTMYATFYGASA
jgi:surface protein